MFLKFKKLVGSVKKDCFRLESYSQLGEDRMIEWALDLLGIKMPTYLDIGTNHPRYLNNTYLFYKKGCKGVCVEPNPILCKKIRQKRKRDVCMQAGILPSDKADMPFLVMSEDTLSTFSESHAESFQRCGYEIVRTVRVPIVNINTIIQRHFGDRPDFISLDVEGCELEIVKNINCRPPLWCVETVDFETIEKENEIIEYFVSNEYMIFADTFLNTIFVDRQAWRKRGKTQP